MKKHVVHKFNVNSALPGLDWWTRCGRIPENRAHVTKLWTGVTCRWCLAYKKSYVVATKSGPEARSA